MRMMGRLGGGVLIGDSIRLMFHETSIELTKATC